MPARTAAEAISKGRAASPVTVLFTDIVGSTQLLGALGEQAMEHCRREHFALLRAAIAAHGGREVKNVGDGLMAAFADEGSGLGCAIAMQTAVAGQQVPGGRELLMRVGAHSGPTIEAEGDHWGTTVVVARRLCDLAQAHEILVTQALAGAANVERELFRDLGRMSLKGLAEPVGVCAMQWDGAPAERDARAEPVRVELHESLRRGAGFVGRERELERLRAWWRVASAGERRLLLVAGEPGIGKTCLVAELGRQVHASGAIVLYGRCDEGLSVAFGPVTEALRQLVAAMAPGRMRTQLGGWAPDLARLPQIADALGGVAPRASSDPEADQHLMFQAVSQLLETTARGAPILLLVEDLQWADGATIALLRHVVAAAPAARIAVLATVREGELADDHPLARGAADAVDRLSLSGLDEAQIAAMIEADGGRPAQRAVARAVHAESSGNPLHAAELARAWSQEGTIVVRDRALVLAGGAPSHGARSDVRSVIGRRVGRLPVDARRALTLGSVLGRSFTLAALEQILAADEPDDLVAALELAVGERAIVRADDGGAYAFAHVLIRHAFYARIGAARRTRLHRQVGEVIEETADDGDQLPELAYHFARCAGDERIAKAVGYALRAGRQSLEQLAHERAAVHFAAALELLEGQDAPAADVLRCDATIGLGECRLRAGDVAYRETLLGAARQAERLGDATRLAQAALANGRGFFSVAGAVDDERVAVLRAALAAVGGADSSVRARLLAQLAMEITYAADPSARLALSDEAVAIARRLEDPATLVTVLYQRAVTHWGAHGLEQRRLAVAEAEPLLDRLADPSLAFHISHQGVHTALESGDVGLADLRLEAMRDHAATTGQATFAWYERIARSKRALCAGSVRESERLAHEAVQTGVASGQPDAELWFAGQVFVLRLVQGRQAEDRYDDLPAMLEAFPALRTLLEAQLACLQAAQGDHARRARDARPPDRRRARRPAAGLRLACHRSRSPATHAGCAPTPSTARSSPPRWPRGPSTSSTWARRGWARRASTSACWRSRCGARSRRTRTSRARPRCTSAAARARGSRTRSSRGPSCCSSTTCPATTGPTRRGSLPTRAGSRASWRCRACSGAPTPCWRATAGRADARSRSAGARPQRRLIAERDPPARGLHPAELAHRLQRARDRLA